MVEDVNIFNISFDAISQNPNPRLPLLSKSHQKPRHRSTNDKFHSLKTPSTAHSFGFKARPKTLISAGILHSTRGGKSQFSPRLKQSPLNILSPRKKTSGPGSFRVDWKTSPLETKVLNENLEFNSERDSSLLTEYQVKHMKEPLVGQIPRSILKSTAKVLGFELQVPFALSDLLPDRQLLAICKSFLEVRMFTIRLLKKIHERERLMMRLVTDSTCNKQSLQAEFMEATFSVIRQIKHWKKLSPSHPKFIYDGQNYLKKIHKDLVFLETSLIVHK
jgi:hypothetical protein